jgi:hypothetical protein
MTHSGVQRLSCGKAPRSWLWFIGLEVRRLLTAFVDQARRPEMVSFPASPLPRKKSSLVMRDLAREQAWEDFTSEERTHRSVL